MSSSPSSNNTSESQQQAKPKTTHHRGAVVGSGGGLKEGLFGLGCGVLYGITSPLVGQPLDTIKTKMQAQASSRSTRN